MLLPCPRPPWDPVPLPHLSLHRVKRSLTVWGTLTGDGEDHLREGLQRLVSLSSPGVWGSDGEVSFSKAARLAGKDAHGHSSPIGREDTPRALTAHSGLAPLRMRSLTFSGPQDSRVERQTSQAQVGTHAQLTLKTAIEVTL